MPGQDGDGALAEMDGHVAVSGETQVSGRDSYLEMKIADVRGLAGSGLGQALSFVHTQANALPGIVPC